MADQMVLFAAARIRGHQYFQHESGPLKYRNEHITIQGRSYDFVIGTAIGKGSGDHIGPQRVQGRALVGGPVGEDPGSSCILTIFNSTECLSIFRL